MKILLIYVNILITNDITYYTLLVVSTSSIPFKHIFISYSNQSYQINLFIRKCSCIYDLRHNNSKIKIF